MILRELFQIWIRKQALWLKLLAAFFLWFYLLLVPINITKYPVEYEMTSQRDRISVKSLIKLVQI